MTRWVAAISLLAAFTLGAASRSIPAISNRQQASLTGINSIFVLVERLPNGAKKLALSEEIIQTDVELKLRLAGLRVVTMAESVNLPGSPYLYVNLNVTSGAEAASIDISLHQDATLQRNGQRAGGVGTWTNEMLIANPSVQGIRNSVKDVTDKFLNDWLAANPK